MGMEHIDSLEDCLFSKQMNEDALFIFNSSLDIISYSGSHIFFANSNESKNRSLLDIVDEVNRDSFQSLLLNAIDKNISLTTKIKIKTKIDILKNCNFELDINWSNLKNDIYVAKLNFIEECGSHLLEYQALILDTLPGIDIYLIDENYNFLFAAGKEKKRYKLHNNEIIGKSLFDVLDQKASRLIYPCVTKALQGIENDGDIRYHGQVYYIKGTPVKSNNKNSGGVILFLQNITNDKFQEEELNRSREEALNADRLKSIFIANVSHEIRTPLNAIMGFTEQLEKTLTLPDQEKLIKLINKASDHLLYLVTEVVFLFKLGMGKVFIENTIFSINDVIAELSESFKKQASEKNLHLTVECDSNIPDRLVGDSYRLRQILMNLLSNAIKYTDKGSILLSCRLEKEDTKRVDLIFEVKDTGIGITKHNLEHIFNVFEQGDKLNASLRGGAGLGLGICKNLVNLLGGYISVSSKIKVGSLFSVFLPFEKSDNTIKLEQKETYYDITSDISLLLGKKILVADDDEHNRLLAQIILTNWKTNFTLVEDGKKAIKLLDKIKYDIALIDIQMPYKNGLDVVRHVKGNKEGINSKTPILFMTANAIKKNVNEYMNCGFDGYLIKPFKEGELFNRVCNALSIGTSKQSTKVHIAQMKSLEIASVDVFNTSDLWKTSNGDYVFFEKMINNFIDSAKILVSVFVQERESQNWSIVGERAHKAIPSFRYFSLSKIASSLEAIENKTLHEFDFELAANIIENTIDDINLAIGQAKESLQNRKIN